MFCIYRFGLCTEPYDSPTKDKEINLTRLSSNKTALNTTEDSSNLKQNNEIHLDPEAQAKEDKDSATCLQTDAYDVIRGSENPSPKSFDSQYSLEDKVSFETIFILNSSFIYTLILPRNIFFKFTLISNNIGCFCNS